MKFKRVDNICNVILWVTGVLIPLGWGIYTYTPEYEEFKKYLNKKIDISIIFIILSAIVIFFVIVTIIKNIAKNAIQLESDKNDLEQEKVQLLNCVDKNIDVRNTLRVNDALKVFVCNTKYVIAVQIYKCDELTTGNTIIYTINGVDYKYVRDGESVNDIKETYKVNSKSLDKYRNLKKAYISNPTKENKSAWAEYVSKLTEKINKRKTLNVTDTMINNYCYILLSIQNMMGEDPVTLDNIDKELQAKINRTKRSGFLRGIIEQDLYKFKNNRNEKKDRIYITKYLYIENYSHIFVITLDSAVSKKKNNAEYLDKVGEKFCDILTNDLNVVYNKYGIN